jgi:hypothetical protein
MGMKRSLERRRQRESREVLKRKFLMVPVVGSVDCPACGREVPIKFPAIPKSGAKITIRAGCPCGNEVAITVTGKGRPGSDREPGFQVHQESPTAPGR